MVSDLDVPHSTRSAGHTGLMDLEAELQRVTAKRRRCLQILEASA